MNDVTRDIMTHYTGSDVETDSIRDDILKHYGIKRRSGRFPFGSGENPYQHSGDFISRVDALKKEGWTDTPENIKKAFNMSTTEYRKVYSNCKNERRRLEVEQAKSLKEKGYSNIKIAEIMGKPNESSIRSLLNADSERRMNEAVNTKEFLKKQIDEKGMIDVGLGVEHDLGVSKTKLDTALALLKEEGYEVHGARVPQPTDKTRQTTLKIACPPGTPHKAIYNYDQIHSVTEYASNDGGETFKKFMYPKSMDSKRLMIRYKEDGGEDKDGIVELRRGVEDLSLGNSHYAQVRILVDNDRYIKGMALYSDDMPDGVDVIFNTNKTKDVPMRKVLKEIKDDPDNPFGSLIMPKGQSEYIDKNGKKQLSLINKRADEGDWSEWKDTVPSQFLSKQPVPMARKQLNLAIADKKAEYDEICSLTNPTVKRYRLKSFADDCDASAVHLKAAALPGQKYNVIIPVNTLKDTEVYAPNYENGTKLALVRYPHGGIFEIPILTVNNNSRTAQKIIPKDVQDAVGINKKIADQLSGADFDGDTVMCIPTHDKSGKVKISNSSPLKGLEGFDPKMEYCERPGMKYMTKRGTQTEMGKISNLITDMTLQGASEDELARAVRHSMVVIDAHKHKLDYKQSEVDNGIAALKKEYQNGGGASTLISRASAETSVLKRQGSPKVNIKGKPHYDPTKPEGSLVYTTSDKLDYTVAKVYKRSKDEPNATVRVSTTGKGKRYIQFDGEDDWIPYDGKSEIADGTRVYGTKISKHRTQQSTRMAETDDAYTLVSDKGTKMEQVYADYANTMKDMANKARIEMESTGKLAYNASAAKTYAKEVKDLETKLKASQSNKPKERMALMLTNAELKAKKQDNPNMTKEEEKKISQMAMTKYRNQVGAKRTPIVITDKEWEAIQAGAIHDSRLKEILTNTDTDRLVELSTPRKTSTLSSAQVSRIKAMSNSNYSNAEIAKMLGISSATVNKYLKGAS